SICSVETESGCFSTSTFMKESDVTPRAFVGQPLPVAGVMKGRRTRPHNDGHPERRPRDPGDITFKLSQRDPSTSLGMTITRALRARKHLALAKFQTNTQAPDNLRNRRSQNSQVCRLPMSLFRPLDSNSRLH